MLPRWVSGGKSGRVHGHRELFCGCTWDTGYGGERRFWNISAHEKHPGDSENPSTRATPRASAGSHSPAGSRGPPRPVTLWGSPDPVALDSLMDPSRRHFRHSPLHSRVRTAMRPLSGVASSVGQLRKVSFISCTELHVRGDGSRHVVVRVRLPVSCHPVDLDRRGGSPPTKRLARE